MRPLRSWMPFGIVLLLALTLSAPNALAQQSPEFATLDAGSRAEFSGILVSREFFDDLILAAEEGGAIEVMERGWRNAIRLAESRGERIAELERAGALRSWVGRGCALAVGTLGYLYGQERGRTGE